jgi:hypothetical protein
LRVLESNKKIPSGYEPTVSTIVYMLPEFKEKIDASPKDDFVEINDRFACLIGNWNSDDYPTLGLVSVSRRQVTGFTKALMLKRKEK